MARPKNAPEKPPKVQGSAMLDPSLLDEFDRLARKFRYSRSQFLGLMIERGYAAFLRDGKLTEPELSDEQEARK